MYVSKFQRYGGAAIVVVLAVAVGAGILPKADRQERLEEKRRLERETWCDVGDARLDPGLPGRPGPIKFDRCTTVDLTMRSEPLGNRARDYCRKRSSGSDTARNTGATYDGCYCNTRTSPTAALDLSREF